MNLIGKLAYYLMMN